MIDDGKLYLSENKRWNPFGAELYDTQYVDKDPKLNSIVFNETNRLEDHPNDDFIYSGQQDSYYEDC